MLARNAESLFWIGRYMERADDTARILDVAIQQLFEDFANDSEDAGKLLFRAFGVNEDKDVPLTTKNILNVLAFNKETNSGSIYDSIKLARENARGTKEVTSTELWECINTTYNALEEKERIAKRLGANQFLNYIKTQAAMFHGIADATMSRDDGYRFLMLGKNIERIDMTSRLLLSRVNDRVDSPSWFNVIKSTGAQDTYMRAYKGTMSAQKVLEFMLLDRMFPRSIYYSVVVAEKCLSDLDSSSLSRIGVEEKSRRIIGRIRGDLEFLDADKLTYKLEKRLLGLQKDCEELTESVRFKYFHVTPYVSWLDTRRTAEF